MAKFLVTTFAMAATMGAAQAATQVPGPAVKAPTTNTQNFNDHAKGVVLIRNRDRDVNNEVLIVKQDGRGNYLIHEPNGVIKRTLGDAGNLRTVNQATLIKEHGPMANLRTLEQFEADSKILKGTSGLNRDLEGASFSMQRRVADIQNDMKLSGDRQPNVVAFKLPANTDLRRTGEELFGLSVQTNKLIDKATGGKFVSGVSDPHSAAGSIAPIEESILKRRDDMEARGNELRGVLNLIITEPGTKPDVVKEAADVQLRLQKLTDPIPAPIITTAPGPAR